MPNNGLTPGARSTSLRTRLLRRLLFPAVALLCIDGSASYFFSLYYANHVYDGWLYDSVSSLALLVERNANGLIFDLPPQTKRMFEWDETDRTYYSVTSSRSGLISGLPSIPTAPASTDYYHRAQIYDGIMDQQRVRIAQLTLTDLDPTQTVTILVAETLSKRASMARNILVSVLFPQLLMILVGAMTIRTGIFAGLAPLESLAAEIENQDPKHPRPIPVAEVPLEVLPLTLSLNRLLSRLNEVGESQRQFLADAAHQLRTPITALKLNLEQAVHAPASGTSQVLLHEALHATERMAHISQQLLTLARTEPEAASSIQFERINLADLAAEIGGEWVRQADAKHIELSMTGELPDPALILGNRVLLTEALSNLLDNAIRYHPGHGQIEIHLEIPDADLDKIRVSVRDDGVGIPAEQRLEALKRFHRLDTHDQDGSGLGLAIVNDIASLHQGLVCFTEGLNGRGIGIGIELPLEKIPAKIP